MLQSNALPWVVLDDDEIYSYQKHAYTLFELSDTESCDTEEDAASSTEVDSEEDQLDKVSSDSDDSSEEDYHVATVHDIR